MGMAFEELDEITRRFMLEEFQREEDDHPYRGKLLSVAGSAAWPKLMTEVIQHGNDDTLMDALDVAAYWTSVDAGGSTVNRGQRAESLAVSEFNTWYVRGLAARLMSEGIDECQVYRAGLPRGTASRECSRHENLIYPVKVLYDGHRARYWPEPGDKSIFAIPYHSGCHHSIRRVSK